MFYLAGLDLLACPFQIHADLIGGGTEFLGQDVQPLNLLQMVLLGDGSFLGEFLRQACGLLEAIVGLPGPLALSDVFAAPTQYQLTLISEMPNGRGQGVDVPRSVRSAVCNCRATQPFLLRREID